MKEEGNGRKWILLYFRQYYHSFHKVGLLILSSSIDIPHSKLLPPMILSLFTFQSYYSILLVILYSFSRFLLCSSCLIPPPHSSRSSFFLYGILLLLHSSCYSSYSLFSFTILPSFNLLLILCSPFFILSHSFLILIPCLLGSS